MSYQRFFQGRMMYPQSVWGRRHPRAGRPHPFLYAGARNRRTRAHAYYGTQPTGYGLRGGDPRFGGVSGAPRRVVHHGLAGAMQRQVPNWVRTRRYTPWGNQARKDMAGLSRDFQRGAGRDFRQQGRKYKSSIIKLNRDQRELKGYKGDRVDSKLAWIKKQRAMLAANFAKQRSAYNKSLSTYKSQRRRFATRKPMHATVTRGTDTVGGGQLAEGRGKITVE